MMDNTENMEISFQAELETVLTEYCQKRFALLELVKCLETQRNRVEAEILTFRQHLRQIIQAERIRREVGQKVGELIQTFDAQFLQTVRSRRQKLEQEIDDIEFCHELATVEIKQLESDIFSAISSTE